MEAGKRIQQLKKRIRQLNDRQVLMHEVLIRSGLAENYPDLQPVTKEINPRANNLVLAFGGMSHNLSLPPAEFLKTLGMIDCSTIFFKDFRQCWYQQGLLGLTRDASETVQYLKELLTQFADKNIISIGTSAGGFAAILFGVAVKAKAVVAFSPQTVIDEDAYLTFRSADTNKEDFAGNMNYPDLRKALADYSNAPTKVYIYYDENNDRDKRHATYLSEDARIILRPFAGSGSHNSASQLKNSGLLSRTLSDIIEP